MAQDCSFRLNLLRFKDFPPQQKKVHHIVVNLYCQAGIRLIWVFFPYNCLFLEINNLILNLFSNLVNIQ